jgi:putative transcriptional regulator
MDLTQGILLLSDPFLKDPHFARSVVLLCEHNVEGSFGLVLNKKTKLVLGEIVEQATGLLIEVFEGGPVQKNSLHFIHLRADLIPESVEVAEGIYWGGDFETVIDLLREKKLTTNDIRFFIGYSGWSAGQLAAEYETKSWIAAAANPALLFLSNSTQIWKDSLHTLGGEYAQMPNYPTDPQLN